MKAQAQHYYWHAAVKGVVRREKFIFTIYTNKKCCNKVKPDLSMKKIPRGNMRFTSRCGPHTWEVFLGCPRSVEASGSLAQMRTFLWCFPGPTARRMWNPTKTSDTKRWCTVKFERLVAGRASARNKWSIIGSEEAARRQMKLVKELHWFLVIDAAH